MACRYKLMKPGEENKSALTEMLLAFRNHRDAKPYTGRIPIVETIPEMRGDVKVYQPPANIPFGMFGKGFTINTEW